MFLPDRLTIGNFLLAEKIYRTVKPEEITASSDCLDKIRAEWTSAWQEKIDSEWRERLRLWSEVLREIRENEDYPLSYYQSEVRNRVIQQLFIADSPSLYEEYEDQLSALDRVLFNNLTPGEFVWSSDIRTAFSPEEYWYLYGCPRNCA